MGEQRRGDSLTEAGDALISWLERWCERQPHGTALKEGNIAVLDTSLRAADDDELTAPHLTLRLTLPTGQGEPPNDERETFHWVLAESWWSETFRPATFNQVVGWVLGIGPWVLATQFHGIRDRVQIPRSGPALLTWLLWPTAILTLAALVAASAVLSLLLTILAVLVLLLRLVPIGPLQSLAEGIQRSLASSFGDLMVLVQSPSRFGAMRSQVRADVRALIESCDNVVVVAHSQGSHIAWEAIRRPADDVHRVPANLVRLITYGQAMSKLRLAYRVLKQELDGGVGLVGAGALVAQLALALILGAWVSAILDGGNTARGVTSWFSAWFGLDEQVLLWVLVGLIVFGNAMLLTRSRREMLDDAQDLRDDIAAATEKRYRFRWVDLWSSADPGPNGPLGASGSANVSSWRVRNAGSVILDHAIYWQNVTEFVGAVAKELGRHGAGTAHFPGDEDPFPDRRLRLAGLTRGARIHVLSALRVMWSGAVLGFGLTLYPTLNRGLDFTWLPENIPVISLLREWLPGIVALAIVAVGSLLGWILIAKIWGAGIRADDRASFAGRAEGPCPWPAWGGLALLAIVPVAATVGLWLVVRGPLLPAVYALSVTFMALAIFTFISNGGRGFAEDPPTEPVRLTVPLLVTAAAFLGTLIAITAGWFRPWDDPSTTTLIIGAAYALLTIPMVTAAVIRLQDFLDRHARLREATP